MITPSPTPTSGHDRFFKLAQWFRPDRPMLVRITSGLIGAALYVAILFLPEYHGLPFALGVTIFSVLGASELYRAVQAQGGEPSEFMGYLACVAFQLAAWTYSNTRFAPYLPALLMLLVIATLLAELGKHRPKPIVNIGTTLLGGIYAGWMFSYLTQLRNLDPGPTSVFSPPIHGTTPGEWIVIFVTAATWLSDAGALFVGKALGRHKLAPAISPAKTWEGAVGGVLLSLLGSMLLGTWLHIPPAQAAGVAALCAVSGQVGDLCESALKRELALKDFGKIVPGHGGVLDRIDSLLFSAPLAYYYIVFFLLPRH